MGFKIFLEGNRIYSNTHKAINLQNSKKFGELKQGKVIYSCFEAFYLVETGKAEVYYKDKLISDRRLIRMFSKKDKGFHIKYIVFKNLRKKGYIVKEGLKFGVEFRVYEKKSKHAKWIIYPIKQSEKINWKEFIAKNRIAHSTAKKLLIAIVDSQEDIIYYEVGWLKF